MRSATAPRPRTRQLRRGWYVAAVLSAVLAVGMCLLGWRQAEQADRISADPIRTEGVVTRVPAGGGTYSVVGYAVADRRYSAADLWLPDGAQVGDRICLERAGSDPDAVRVCGRSYPQAAGVRLAQTTVPLALLVFLTCAIRIWRHGAAHAGYARVAVAFGVEPLADTGRRRRKGGRRAAR